MNVVFISPNFPPTYFLFAVRLREEGATVLGVADAPWKGLRAELQAALTDYVHVPDMNHYDSMLRAVAMLTWKHGKIDWIDSQNEHWLPIEARLRADFNVFGQKPEDLATNRSKMRMKEIFREAGISCEPAEHVRDPRRALEFARAHGYPVVLKPDTGVGAQGAFRVDSREELERVLSSLGEGYVIEKFLTGEIQSFDGLTDLSGEIVYCTSHVFNSGIMEVVKDLGPMHYYSLCEIPEDLDRLGRAIVKAFNIRGRFFHIEFFRLRDGSLRPLEVNVRPPGGFTTDMMNYAADIDVYGLWAKVITGHLKAGRSFERQYHVAHVSRREHKRYAIPHDEIVRRLGDKLVMHMPMPLALSGAMGDYAYLVRSPDLVELESLIAEVEREVG